MFSCPWCQIRFVHSHAVCTHITSAAPPATCASFIEHRAREYVHFWLTQQLRRSSEAACRSGLNHLNAMGKGKSMEEVCEGKKHSRQPSDHTRQSSMTKLCKRLSPAPRAELCYCSALSTRHTHTLSVTLKQSAVSSATSSCLSFCPSHLHRDNMKGNAMQMRSESYGKHWGK